MNDFGLPPSPYEEAEQQQREEAKLVVPKPAKKNRKIVIVGFVLMGVILAVVILSHLAGMVTGPAQSAHLIPKPTTLTEQQSDAFARQQSGEAGYLKGMDRDKNRQKSEDTVLGQASGLASDAYDETDGVPTKTKAQDDAEHGRGGGRPAKSEAEQQRERAALEAAHRRQSDLDASPLSVDFSGYFEKEKQPSAAPASTEAAAETPAKRRHSAAFSDVLGEEGNEAELESASNKKQVQAHDPKEDYPFDSSVGKLYRLMEDTILETVLVNRLTGASVGPVITMVTSDVFSENGSHLLIPKGTRLLGSVRSVGSVNQERLFVAFHRMIMPDGYSVSLDKFQGLDVVGQTGLRDLVNHHYIQIFGASLALAAVSATTQIGNSGGNYGTYDWGVEMRNGVSQGLGQTAQRVMERFMNILPTFTIRERARVKVMLAGDLLLPDTQNHTMDPDL
jgi:type IV secretion system protein TrbI